MMYDEKFHLHPISAVVNFVKGLKDFVLPFLIVFVSNGFRGDGDWTSYISYIVGAVGLIFLLVAGIVKWKRFVYWFEDDELRIEYGLFVKKKRYIPFERIQSLSYNEGILHRPLGLVKVRIETAGSGSSKEAEAELTAISKQAANQIEEVLAYAKKRKNMPEQDEATDAHTVPEQNFVKTEVKPIFKMSVKDIIVLAATSGGIGVVFSGLAVFVSQFSDFIPYDWIYEEFMGILKFGVLVITLAVFAVFLLAWIVSVVMNLINYFQFQIVHEDHQLIITRGLLEKRKTTLPLRRIQAIRIIENPLRQLFGYCSVIVESAGGAGEEKDQKLKLVPLMKRSEVMPLLQQVFPEVVEPAHWIKPPKRALAYYYRADLLWMVIPIALVSIFYFPYGLLTIIFLPLVMLCGYWQYRSTGFTETDKQLVARFRELSKHTVFVQKKRIQSCQRKQNWFQRKRQLATISFSIKSGQGKYEPKLRHIAKSDANEFMSWYLPKQN